ncbi:MAG: hypothetical protein MK132_22530 [Lentisphaerales bacterium]|nr:hypothetical protein [Lentisphaerales bacterium]
MRTRVTPEPLPKAPLVPTNSQTPKNYIPATNASQELIDEQTKIVAEGYGSFPAVDLKNMTPHKQHVLDALKAPHKNSGVVSIVGKREKFDLSRYQQAPSYYLDTVEAGRAFDSIQAGDGVTPITRIGSGFQETEQNKPITLTAKGSPEMPVSFTVFDGGQFQNGLSFITVQADSSGYASVEFTATAGVINQTRIKAASPVNSQTVNWKVLVHLPKEISKNNN